MLLDSLVRAIETIRDRIRDHGQSLREHETRTRAALIDPLLSALGWDLSDPALVTPEYSVGSRRADYALLDGQSQPVVFLEAKRLDESLLPAHRSQVVAYASELGIRYPALTNGDSWEVYDNSQLVPIEQRRILHISIVKDPVPQTALKLLLLWRPNLSSGVPAVALEPIVNGGEEFIDPPPLAPPPPMSPSGWTSLAGYNPEAGAKPPSAIRFVDGTQREVKFWWELVKHTAEWLVSASHLTRDKLPIYSGPKRYVVNAQAIHPSGNPFKSSADIAGTTWKLEAHRSASGSRQSVRSILEHCNVDPATVWLKVE